MLTFVFLILVILAAIGGLVALVGYIENAQRDAFQALAARRGWSLNIAKRSMGRPPVLRLSSRGGPEWEARGRHVPGDRGAFRTARTTEFIGQDPRWQDGTLFIGSDHVDWPEDTRPPNAEAIDDILRRRIVGQGRAADITTLTRRPAPEGIAAYTTTDPGFRFDFDELAALWRDWPPRGPGADGYPTLQFGPEGLWLHLPHGTRTADDMEAFVDFALTLGRLFSDR